MDSTVKAALITGILGLIGTITAAIIGVNVGKSITQNNIQKQFNTAIGNGVNIVGNANEITINDIENFMNNYINLQEQKESLLEQNTKYFNDLTEANNKIADLQSETNGVPVFNFSDLALSIDGEDIPVNKNNSMITIDGVDYFSREITESLISDNQNFTIKDDTLFIGRVIAEKAKLTGQKEINHSSYCYFYDSISDSYGNSYADVIVLDNRGNIIYNLERKYSMLDISLAISSSAYLDMSGILTIEADEETVYTSSQLTKITEPFTITQIPINNCSLLTIKYSGDWNNRCIISNAIVYN